MNTSRLSFKAVFLFILLSAACVSVPPNADREEGQAAITSKTSDADKKEVQSAFDSKDYAKATRLLTPLAEQGNPKAQYALGTMYAEGSGVSKDYSEAMKWFRKSAEQGYPKGQAVLGWMYDSGSGVDKDYSEAAKWYRKAAEQGVPYAQTALGTMYGQGRGVSRDYSEAMIWYRKAAEQGYPDAQWRVGAMYVKGQSVSKDYTAAEKWFRRAALQSNPQGQLGLGRLYLEGWGVDRNIAEATMWYLLAVSELRKAGIPVERIKDAQGTLASALLLKAVAYPPEVLAMSYLWIKKMLHFLPAVEGGGTIQLPDETITISNVEEYRGKYERRLSLYKEAIKQRGYKTISGTYKGETTESCARIKSAWVGVIHERIQSGIEIAQDGMDAQVVIRAKHEGKELSLKNQAAIAESAISVMDAMNSDYFFRGKIKNQVIVIKPSLLVLNTWPNWAGPPSRSDLENCTITLKPLSADSESEQR